ncbi:MAG: TlpA family protein disulfide reductase [Pyrinomonadaceae bacterium]|nr:TlpA family protein disulfide reductase [Pyrinomonadaceae bacterium]
MQTFQKLFGSAIALVFVLAAHPAKNSNFVAGNVLIIAEQASELPRADDPSGARTGVPDYTMQTLKGKEMRLSAQRGHPVLLDFFLADCPHCKAHAPYVADLARRFRAQGLTVVNLTPNNPYTERESVETYAREAKIENEVAFVSGEVAMLYLTQNEAGHYGFPQAVLFDAAGRIAARFDKWEEKDRPRIEAAITKQLAK